MSVEDIQKKLAAFKKANKERRKRIVAIEGFTDEASYVKCLQGMIKNVDRIKKVVQKIKLEEKNIPTIHNVYILDGSGSMEGEKLNNAIIGINEEISKLKEDTTVKYTQTIVDFSSSHDIRISYFLTPIKDVVHFSCFARGYTALYQAMGETLTRLKNSVPTGDKVLVKIFTDGQENASIGKFTSTTILSKLIKDVENLGFTVTFVGTESDVDRVSRALTIDISNTLVHDNTARGVADSFERSLGSTISYAENVKAGKDVSKGFYKKVGKIE